MSDFSFDLNTVPFSRTESYVGVGISPRAEGIYLRHLRGAALRQWELFRVEVLADDESIPYETHATSALLTLKTARGSIEICIDTGDLVRVRGENVGLRLSRHMQTNEFDNAYSPDGDRWEAIIYGGAAKVGLRALDGLLAVDAPWRGARSEYIVADFLPDASGKFEGIVQIYDSVWPRERMLQSFDAVVKSAQASFDRWLEKTLPVPDQWAQARALAAYINWSCVVPAGGYHKRPAMLMSKNWMNKVWSWDHCFNALALAQHDAALAWDQFVLFFDHQNEEGALPDHLTEATISFRFYKPPIHGWTLRRLMQFGADISNDQLADIYEPLGKWTQWWLKSRDDDGDGVPQYNHGNESGWDNGTVFASGVPVESPDLPGYLVVQMDVLAEVAARLGKDDDAALWQKHAANLLQKLIDHAWNGSQFVAKRSGSHEIPDGDSSLVFMPLILGDRLEKPMRDSLIAELRRFVTDHGLATEHPDSGYYTPDGYWRGPIWAPSTYLLVDGLIACGETDLADEVSRKFCEMCAHSGMAENYDALTGDGLRDRAYTWTSSVFLLLANRLYAR